MIKQSAKTFPVRLMCRLLSVSTSGYYDWLNRPESKSQQISQALEKKIKAVFDEEKQRAGSPRITKRLHAQGCRVGHNQVARLMRKNGWRARSARKFKASTNCNHRLPVAPDLLQQNFSAAQTDEKWVSDITSVWTDEGWLYLVVVMDLYSRLVVGWAMSGRMTSQLVQDTLQMALWRRKKPDGVIIHSDRGSQYCSYDYQQMIKVNGLICSMSKRGDCYDNSAMESWNHSLKVEAIHGERF